MDCVNICIVDVIKTFAIFCIFPPLNLKSNDILTLYL